MMANECLLAAARVCDRTSLCMQQQTISQIKKHIQQTSCRHETTYNLTKQVVSDTQCGQEAQHAKLTQNVSKVWEHGCNESSKEDVRAANHSPDQPVLHCPYTRVIIHVLGLKMLCDWCNVQLQ